MTLKSFLMTLHDEGRAPLETPREPTGEDLRELTDAIRELDAEARIEAPFQAPALSMPAATWAAVTFYRACQFLAYREIDADTVTKALSQPCPEPRSPSTTYSVDLVFRYLPDLVSLSRGIAEGDPLVAGLLALARDWPLSSVGVQGTENVDVSSFIDDASLRQTYVDRILQRKDVSRLSDQRVRRWVERSLGGHPELRPDVAKALKGEEKTA